MKPHPWLQPLYRRMIVTFFCFVWTAWEGYYDASSIWFLLMLGISAWAVWDFFISGNYAPEAGDADKAESGDG